METALLRLHIMTLTYLRTLAAKLWRSVQREPARGYTGQAFLEYALVIAVVAVIVLVAVQAFGTDLTAVFERIRKRLSSLG